MKIVAVLEQSVQTGGGFNQALNAILQLKRLSEGKFKYSVVSLNEENIAYLKHFDIDGVFVKLGMLDKISLFLFDNTIFRKIINKYRIIGNLEKELLKQNCDLVYFVMPTLRAALLQQLNYIVTVWDLCHRDELEFPEVRKFGAFQAREKIYHNILSPAVVILVDSETLAESTVLRYGIDRKRILPMPYSPSPFLKEYSKIYEVDVLKMYGLEPGYFFYPAQFWAHKNHIRILQALSILNEQEIECNVCFAGGDQGNMNYIKDMVKHYGLENQIRLLGFIPPEHMKGLYQNCRAVVMPTYFGPTNLPPLEAWSLGKPLIYSNLLEDQTGDAARLINPDCPEELANAMNEMLDDSNVEKYVERGKRRLKEISNKRDKYEKQLISRLIRFEKILECWKF
jgi:glycosyltransferase involved in cell wall biosynthesis